VEGVDVMPGPDEQWAAQEAHQGPRLADLLCSASARFLQGQDTIRCQLMKGHEGAHRIIGRFLAQWDQDETP